MPASTSAEGRAFHRPAGLVDPDATPPTTVDDSPSEQTAAGAVPPDVRLKQLLLGSELERLARMERQGRDLSARVGDDAALRASVTAVIVDVLREAGVRDHERMAGVLAPLILASLREEIRNSRDLMVDALYPITGRLVSAAVSNAFRDLVDRLNRQLDNTLSFDRWVIRVQSLATGVSEAELMLRKHPPFGIDELLLIHRPTGLLIDRVRQNPKSNPDGGADRDVVGGMITAIMAFTRDAAGPDEQGELRTFTVGQAEFFIHTSPAVILAVKTRGTAPPGFDTRLEALFVEFLERWGDALRTFDGNRDEVADGAMRSDLEQRFGDVAAAAAEPRRKPPIKALACLGAVAAGLIGLAGWSWIEERRVAALVASAETTIVAEPRLAGWPITVAYDADAESLRVAGLAPDAEAREALSLALATALPETPVTLTIATPPDPAGERVGALAADLDRVGDELRRIEAQVAAIAADQAAGAAWRGGPLRGQLDTIARRLAAIDERLADPADVLVDWSARNAVYFATDTTFRDGSAAAATLDALAALLGRVPDTVRLRVVGYADSLGGSRERETLSRDRAEAVVDALVARGVARTRLIAVGRADQRPVHPDVGPNSPNRRVEFEPAFGDG